MRAKNAKRLRINALLLLLLAFTGTSHAGVPKYVPEQFQGFFRQYVDNRSITEKALNAIGFTNEDVGRSFALVAGVSHYRMNGRAGKLDAARADVEQLAAYLINREFFDEVVVLLDEDVTEANLSYFLERYFPKQLQAFPGSRFLFAYSGHGTTRPDGHGFLLTSDATGFDDFMEHGIDLSVVRAMLNADVYSGHFVLVLVNACYASDLHGRVSFGDTPYWPKLEGAHVITAGGSNEQTWADPSLGPGSIFFETLLAGLNGRADRLPQDGIVTEKEIETYLIGTIKQFTDEHQNPYASDLRPERSRGGFFFLDQERMVERKVLGPWDPRRLWSFGGDQQAALERAPRVQPARQPTKCEQCPRMEGLPAGSFKDIAIPKPFALGKYEVTPDEWDACVKDGGCTGYESHRPSWTVGDQSPGISVSKDGARAYVAWLNGKTGQHYRLPSAAEWKYALARARAGRASSWGFGAWIPDDVNHSWEWLEEEDPLAGRDVDSIILGRILGGLQLRFRVALTLR
jgi:hypothetical protein